MITHLDNSFSDKNRSQSKQTSKKLTETPSPKKKSTSKPKTQLLSSFDKSRIIGKEPSSGRYSMKIKSNNEALSNKMPNFIMNYEVLLERVTNSKELKTTKENISKVSQSESNKGYINKNMNLNNAEVCPFTMPSEWKNKVVSKTRESKPLHDTHNIDDLVTTVKQRKTASNILHPPSSTIILQPVNPEEERCKEMRSLTNTEDIRDFYENTEECLKRIAKIKPVSEKEISHLVFDLPFEEDLKEKKLAVFDLDETLVHCEIKKPSKGEVQLMVKIPSGAMTKVIFF